MVEAWARREKLPEPLSHSHKMLTALARETFLLENAYQELKQEDESLVIRHRQLTDDAKAVSKAKDSLSALLQTPAVRTIILSVLLRSATRCLSAACMTQACRPCLWCHRPCQASAVCRVGMAERPEHHQRRRQCSVKQTQQPTLLQPPINLDRPTSASGTRAQ
jgi:hypothetical protein